MTDTGDLVEDLLDGEHRALARVITIIENRQSGYRDLVSALHEHTGDAEIVGVTGSPGSGKSTLVDKLAARYREQGLTVGIIAVDPSSPFTGGAVLGDRIRMASNVGDMDVFVRSMSARGQLGGLSTATADAVKALDAFGKDRIVVETVGAGQNEVDVVRTADTVAVLVQPGSGDDVQMLKAGILEIGDVFVVNKADMDGAERTVKQLRQMIQQNQGSYDRSAPGHHGAAAMAGTGEQENDVGPGDNSEGGGMPSDADDAGAWEPRVVETIATTGEGVDDLIGALDDHRAYLESSGRLEEKVRTRYAEELWTLVREDLGGLVASEFEERGGLDAVIDAVVERKTDPYTLADDIVDPIAECVRDGDE